MLRSSLIFFPQIQSFIQILTLKPTNQENRHYFSLLADFFFFKALWLYHNQVLESQTKAEFLTKGLLEHQEQSELVRNNPILTTPPMITKDTSAPPWSPSAFSPLSCDSNAMRYRRRCPKAALHQAVPLHKAKKPSSQLDLRQTLVINK